MALSSVSAALTQLNANLLWEGSVSSARLALEAVRYLRVNRPLESSDGGLKMLYEGLPRMEEELKGFLDSSGGGVARSVFVRAKAKYR